MTHAFPTRRSSDRHLDHGPLGGEGAGEHRDAADLVDRVGERVDDVAVGRRRVEIGQVLGDGLARDGEAVAVERSEEHTSELQSLMRISYAVFCLKKKNKKNTNYYTTMTSYE